MADFELIIYALERILRDVTIDDDWKKRAEIELKKIKVLTS